MTIKERILEESLSQFNAHGVDKITVRHIAAALGISHGNLCYHYKRKEDIIYSLYLRLVEEMNQYLLEYNPEGANIRRMYEQVVKSFSTLYKYKFLLLDLVLIARKIPELKVHFIHVKEQRKTEFGFLFYLLTSLGYFKEGINEVEIGVFTEQLFLMTNFWICESEVLYTGKEEDKKEYYARLAFALIVPLLSDKGLQEYKELIAEFSIR